MAGVLFAHNWSSTELHHCPTFLCVFVRAVCLSGQCHVPERLRGILEGHRRDELGPRLDALSWVYVAWYRLPRPIVLHDSGAIGRLGIPRSYVRVCGGQDEETADAVLTDPRFEGHREGKD